MLRRAPFTLIELLVVVSIIAILAAMLLPAMAKARNITKQAVCLSNLRQCGMAMDLYAGDWDEYMPSNNVDQAHNTNLTDAQGIAGVASSFQVCRVGRVRYPGELGNGGALIDRYMGFKALWCPSLQTQWGSELNTMGQGIAEANYKAIPNNGDISVGYLFRTQVYYPGRTSWPSCAPISPSRDPKLASRPLAS